jgi:two-component system, NarL family, response regulator NreC
VITVIGRNVLAGPGMKVISLLVIGDEMIARLGVRHLLMSEAGFEVRGEAASKDAVEQASKLRPDVVLVFAEARPGCAVVVDSIHKEVPGAGIVILGRETHHTYLGMLLAAGALGYVLLSGTHRQLRDAIRAAARGRRFVDPSLSGELYELLARQAESGTKLLSHREQQVLSMLAYGHTLKEIAALLNISRKTIETYRARIREKLGLHTRADVVRYALETGMLNVEAERTA